MGVILRPVQLDDLARLRVLNQAAIPHVNSLTVAQLDWFRVQAPYFRVAESDGAIAGFLTALFPEADYQSPNLLWFRNHRDRFVYVDRIIVAGPVRGTGIGRLLYADLEGFSRPFARLLTCEVNLRPPNPGSLAFHRRLGFHEAGRQELDGGTREVVLLEKDLTAAR